MTVILAAVIGGLIGNFLPNNNAGPSAENTNALALPSKNTISGIPKVTDGDTIKINGTRIRFHGIDAPESRQNCLDNEGKVWSCGTASTSYLKSIVSNKMVTCEQRDIDKYGRVVAVCSIDGKDINGLMVEAGFSLAFSLSPPRHDLLICRSIHQVQKAAVQPLLHSLASCCKCGGESSYWIMFSCS